jgi:hypothetical protein
MNAQVVDLAIARLLTSAGLPPSALGSQRWRRETVEMFAYRMPWLASGLDATELAEMLDEVQRALDGCAPSPLPPTTPRARKNR